MSLKEVLELGKGSLIELYILANKEVEILVNVKNCIWTSGSC